VAGVSRVAADCHYIKLLDVSVSQGVQEMRGDTFMARLLDLNGVLNEWSE